MIQVNGLLDSPASPLSVESLAYLIHAFSKDTKDNQPALKKILMVGRYDFDEGF
jgi:hypothetical protein